MCIYIYIIRMEKHEYDFMNDEEKKQYHEIANEPIQLSPDHENFIGTELWFYIEHLQSKWSAAKRGKILLKYTTLSEDVVNYIILKYIYEYYHA